MSAPPPPPPPPLPTASSALSSGGASLKRKRGTARRYPKRCSDCGHFMDAEPYKGMHAHFSGNECSVEAKLNEEEKRLLKTKKSLRGKCLKNCDGCQNYLQQRSEKNSGGSSSGGGRKEEEDEEQDEEEEPFYECKERF